MRSEHLQRREPRVAVATQQQLDWRKLAIVATTAIASVFAVFAVMAFSTDEQSYSPDAEPPAVFVFVAD